MTPATSSCAKEYFDLVKSCIVPGLCGEAAWTDGLARALQKVIGDLGSLGEKMRKVARVHAPAGDLLQKAHRTGDAERIAKAEASHVADLALAKSYSDLAENIEALRSTLIAKAAEPGPERDGRRYGTPLHLIGRAIPRPGDAWH